MINLDWKIPIASIVAAAGTVIFCLWILAHRDASLDDHGRRIVLLEVAVEAQRTKADSVSELLARIDERLRILIPAYSDPARKAVK
jgi:hypothetical protein